MSDLRSPSRVHDREAEAAGEDLVITANVVGEEAASILIRYAR